MFATNMNEARKFAESQISLVTSYLLEDSRMEVTRRIACETNLRFTGFGHKIQNFF